jgi:membrane-bound inhibitor of C-type lysozyme
MKQFSTILAMTVLTTLVACNAPATDKNSEAEANPVVMTSPVSPAKEQPADGQPEQTRYVCDNGKIVMARYNNAGKESSAQLSIDGKSYGLYQVISASGSKYATEQGPKPDHLFVWWTKGKEATWYESALDHTANDEKRVATCKS